MKTKLFPKLVPAPDPDDHPFFNLSVKQAEIAARRLAMADPVPVTAPVELLRGNMSALKIASIYAGQRYDQYHGREPTHGAACMPGKQVVTPWGGSVLGGA